MNHPYDGIPLRTSGKNFFYFLIVLSALIFQDATAQTVRILFDATKAETAGNADWVVDADQFNLGFFNGPAVIGQSNESNPAITPTPAQSTVSGTTAESYWEGGLSYWGLDCVRQGYRVETLPYNGHITFGNTANTQDLSNYKVFIVCEPNILFTASEKTAILQFVQQGGGLFMISDHDVSDRNGDGDDSPHIWNDFMNNNSITSNPFGITFDYANFSQTSTTIVNAPVDSVLHGPYGNVTEVQWSNGTSMTLNASINPSVHGLIYKTSGSGSSNVLFACARYGNGKIAAISDSSPCDDGSGDPNDQLYDGYIADANGNHRKLLMNATIWLASNPVSAGIDGPKEEATVRVWPNPALDHISVKFSSMADVTAQWILSDFSGRICKQFDYEVAEGNVTIDISSLAVGSYFLFKKEDAITFVGRFNKQ